MQHDDRTSNGALLRWMESIDNRLETLRQSVDGMGSQMVTQSMCNSRHAELDATVRGKVSKGDIALVVGVVSFVGLGLAILNSYFGLLGSIGKVIAGQ